MTVVAGRRDGRCLLCQPAPEQMAVVQATLAHRFATLGLLPRQIQTDRGSCFIGAEEDTRAALPGRLTLWLAGLGISHRLIPVRRPQHNGAVERFHGGGEHRWRDEADGLAALIAVWNATRPPLSEAPQPYRGRAGFDLAPVWALLEQTRVERRVNRQGKLSLWNRPLWIGTRSAGQTVTVTFDAAQRYLIIRDVHDQIQREAVVPWLTEDWLWEPVPLADQVADSSDRSTFT